MEQNGKNGNSFFAFGNGKKMIVGALLLVGGMMAQSFSSKTLAQIPFLFMAMGLMCFVNALLSKISGKNINLFLCLAVQLAALELGLAMTSYHLPGTAEEPDTMTISLIWVSLILAVWFLLGFILRRAGVSRFMALAALMVFLSALAALAAFIVPIFLSVII